MTTIVTDSQIDKALMLIEKHDEALAEQYATKLDEAEGTPQFDQIAAYIIRMAAVLEKSTPSETKTAQPKPVQVPAPPRTIGTYRVLGIVALVFGLFFWIPGAHYQLDGWTLVANALLDLVRAEYTLPLATGVWALLLIPVGILHSVGERKYLPLWKNGKRWQFLGWGVVLVWVLVNGADLLSAYIGIIQPPAPDAWAITKRMAQTQWMQIAWMITVVYIGDILIALGWRWIGIPIRWPWKR